MMVVLTVRAEAHLIMEFRDHADVDEMIRQLQRAKVEEKFPFRFPHKVFLEEQQP